MKRSPLKTKRNSTSGARSPLRTDVILDIAAQSFLEKGFEATSVNEIARLAHASKETIYGKFADKSALFRAVMQRVMDRVADESIAALAIQISPALALSEFGWLMLERLLVERGIQIQKMIAMESDRFPELSRLFYELGPQRTIAALTFYFEAQVERGTLRKMNSRIAAEHFMGILTSQLMLRRSLGLLEPLTPEEKFERIHAAVEVFLRAYGPAM